MIFNDWRISGGLCAMQYDNLSRQLTVLGDLPEGWTWDMLVQCGSALDISHLSPIPGGVEATLTKDQLALSGIYTMQLRGTQGETVRHTNQILIPISPSLSGDAHWPSVPSEFSQMEARIRAMNEHPPVPGADGFWMLWNPDTGIYEASDIPLPAGSGGSYNIGHGLLLDRSSNTLSVDTVDDFEGDNTLPITAAAVQNTVGNIEILLGTI